MAGAPETLVATARGELLEQARSGAIVVIDVRPRDEYDAAHCLLPAHCRWPSSKHGWRNCLSIRISSLTVAALFCVFADTAVQLLGARGYRARKLRDGVSEWHAAGLPLARIAA